MDLLFSRLRSKLGLDEPYEELCAAIAEDTIHHQEVVRQAAALSLAQVLESHPSHISATLENLIDQFDKKLYVSTPYAKGFSLSKFLKILSQNLGINFLFN